MASAVFHKVFPVLALPLAVVAAPVSAQIKSEGYAFLEAVEKRDGDVATEALKKPGSIIVNTRDATTGETAMHIVVKREDVLWIKFLAQNGANPNIADKNDVTPLQIAATAGKVPVVEALLKAGANINDASSSGETALISAVHNRNIALVRLLLSKGADPDHNDNSGRSARDYVDLQTSNSQMLLEFRRADEEREGKAKPQSYGPTL